MIEIYLLEQLDAFARHGTLSAAAQALGVALFIRSKNHLALNETGRRAAQYARHVLTADQDFEDKVKAYDRSLHTLSIGFCAPVPQIVLTPIINSIF